VDVDNLDDLRRMVITGQATEIPGESVPSPEPAPKKKAKGKK